MEFIATQYGFDIIQKNILIGQIYKTNIIYEIQIHTFNRELSISEMEEILNKAKECIKDI